MKRLKIKNALSALISRLNTVKERIEEHEDKSTEITQSETQQKREKAKQIRTFKSFGAILLV